MNTSNQHTHEYSPYERRLPPMRPGEPHYISYPPPHPSAIHRTTSHIAPTAWQPAPGTAGKRYTSHSPPAQPTQPWSAYTEYPSPTSPHDPRPAPQQFAVSSPMKRKMSPEADEAGKRTRTTKEDEEEAVRILEERRKRNANASARFRKRRNERERELIDRCLYMEQRLLEVLGQKRFAEVVEKAPAAAAIEGAAKRVVPVAKNAGLSIDALTSAPTVEDVWETCEKLKEMLGESMDRIQKLEETAEAAKKQ
ncbi:hypothetical protein EC988_002697 [Linderina pennispora]|nr:hypothetical protein EC988_002697 [Linderina pennispora]